MPDIRILRYRKLVDVATHYPAASKLIFLVEKIRWLDSIEAGNKFKFAQFVIEN